MVYFLQSIKIWGNIIINPKFIILFFFQFSLGFPDSSVGKESTCNAGDPSSIPGVGRSTGEGLGYSLQYSWASLMAQLVRNPPVKQETCFDPWVGKIPWRRKGYPLWCSGLESFTDCIVYGSAKSQTPLSLSMFIFCSSTPSRTLNSI